VQVEADPVKMRLQSQIARRQHDRARARRRAREDLRQLAAHHHANELIAGEVEGTCRADVSAVTQHGYLIRDLEQLVHLVGDVENALPLRPQLADDREQVLRVLLGERRGWLVHDEQLGLVREGLCDLDHLAARDREGAHLGLRVDIDAEALEQGARPAA